MKFRFLLYVGLLYSVAANTQPVPASQLLQNIKKLNVLGSVLYIAAHPDDENTRLITYLANEKLYRTGYLSLTRGDGGQNLIGDEQGIELGLIRTQELLAARRIDGGEQFFTRAYDFGYSKSPEETFTKWGKDKVLADVVWVIRKFRPDIIVTRFPTTGEGGHGHHTASAILANEAFKAAADPARFKDQLKYVQPWQARRIVWNTFNFGGNNTTDPSQFNVNVGGYNALMGRSYGEIAAQSRSQHKSQGFGAAATRGDSYEYFRTTGGDAPREDLLDGVDITWNRVGKRGAVYQQAIADIVARYDASSPQRSVPALTALYQLLDKAGSDYWINKKKEEVQQLIADCSGLFIDVYTNQAFAVQTGDLRIQVVANNRLGADAVIKSVSVDGISESINKRLETNKNFSFDKRIAVPVSKEITQPYWLKERMEEGLYEVPDQLLIGMPDVQPAYKVEVVVTVQGQDLTFEKPLRYRFTDPVKGEVYQPLPVIPPATITASPNLLVFNKAENRTQDLQTHLLAYTEIPGNIKAGLTGIDYSPVQTAASGGKAGHTITFDFKVTDTHQPDEVYTVSAHAGKDGKEDTAAYSLALKTISYDHIPAIRYFYPDFVTALNINLKTVGKNIGYIPGAGDKVATVLERMGYQVVILDKATLTSTDLSRFDAILTGVRAYNTNDWLVEQHDRLMSYVKEGGNLIVQYNTNNNLGRLTSAIGPYHFNITRNRITDENAKVTLLDPAHPVFNFPNKISEKDFGHWVQERSIYHAGSWNKAFTPLLSMADPGEKPDEGSLITARYGKGHFTYTGLVFFRQLPAAVPGAMRLLANLIALNAERE